MPAYALASTSARRQWAATRASTAILLREAARRGPQPGDRVWPFAEAWAAELALPSAAAAVRTARGTEAAERDYPVPRDADREAE